MKAELLKTLGIIAGSGGLGAWLSYQLGNRKQDVSEFGSIVNEYRTLLIGFKQEIKELRAEVDELRFLLMDKHDEVSYLESELKIIKENANNRKL